MVKVVDYRRLVAYLIHDCKEDMSGQLSNFHLSKSNLRENELIAIRAGMFNLTEDQFKMMFICPSHRHNLGRFWRPLRPCQYSLHSGPVRKCTGLKRCFQCVIIKNSFYSLWEINSNRIS